MQAVLPRPDVAPLLKEHFVLLAADPDEPEPVVQDLLSRMKGAMMLPFVILADAEGGFLDGKSGVVDPAQLRVLLETASG